MKWYLWRFRLLFLGLVGMLSFTQLTAQRDGRRLEVVLDSISNRFSSTKTGSELISSAISINAVVSHAEKTRPKSDPLFAAGYAMLGQVYYAMGEPTLSIQNDLKSISLLSNQAVLSNRNLLQLLEMTERVARNYQRLGDVAHAESYALLAVNQSDTLQDSLPDGHASALMVLADIYQGASKWTDARGCLLKAMEIRMQKTKTDRNPAAQRDLAQKLAATYEGLARNFIGVQGADSALYWLDKTLPLQRHCGNVQLASISQSRAAAYMAPLPSGAPAPTMSDALPHFALAVKLRKTDSIPDRLAVAALLEAQADCFIRLDRNEAALRCLQEALILAVPGFRDSLSKSNPKPEFWTSNPLMFRILVAKAVAFKALGQMQFSLKCYEDAFQFVDRLRQDYRLAGALQFESKVLYGLYEDAIELAYSEYESTQWDTYKDRLFLLMERSKTNDILKSLHDAEQLGAVRLPDSLLLGLRQRQALLHETRGTGRAIRKASEGLQQFQSQLDLQIPGYQTLTEPATLIQPGAVTGIADENEVFLEYFVGRRAIYIYAFDNLGSQCFRVPIDASFGQAVSLVSATVSQVPDPAKVELQWLRYQKAAHLLYLMLVEPVVHAGFHGKPPKSIVVIPDGQLAMIPFECLLTRRGGSLHYLTAAYLVRECNIRYGPSATLLAAQRHHKWEELSGMLALATNPNGTAKMSDLDDEAEAAEKVFDGKALYGRRATKADFFKLAHNYRLMHLACIGQVDTLMPMHSHLVLDNGAGSIDSLFAFEVLGMRLSAELTTLGTPVQAPGRLPRSEDVMTLSRAFMVAGCPRMLASLWSQPARITPTSIDKFYERLKKGKEVDQSLRDARLDYLGSSKVMDEAVLAHPFYWASLVDIGDDGPRLSQGPTNWTPWLIWGAIVAIVIALIQRRQRRQRRRGLRA